MANQVLCDLPTHTHTPTHTSPTSSPTALSHHLPHLSQTQRPPPTSGPLHLLYSLPGTWPPHMLTPSLPPVSALPLDVTFTEAHPDHIPGPESMIGSCLSLPYPASWHLTTYIQPYIYMFICLSSVFPTRTSTPRRQALCPLCSPLPPQYLKASGIQWMLNNIC